METPRNDQFPIDIDPQLRTPALTDAAAVRTGAGNGGLGQEQTMAFFSVSKNRDSSWVVSLFVLLHLVAFTVTMIQNNCWQNSHGDCAFRFLGRFSFQPFYENPLLGPSDSTLDKMGALRETHVIRNHNNIWRLFTSPWLHAGALHLMIEVASVIFVGIQLEQKFGPWRVGIIYVLSGFTGSLVAALFVGSSPAVCSSGALFGLIGSMLSGLIRSWKSYNDKMLALIALSFITTINFILGLLPHVDNFASIGGFISGFLLGFVLYFTPQLRSVASHKGIFDYGAAKSSSGALKQKLDRLVLRSISLVLFCFVVICALVMVLNGFSLREHCSWCQYINCVPSGTWTCDTTKHDSCLATISGGQLTITCINNDKFRVLPFTSFKPARLEDMCSLICL
ncbi:hypothetical protein Dimus_006790 [Dionaea muscipula]